MTSKKLTEEPLKRRRFMKTAVGLTLAPIAIGLWGCGGSNSASDSSTTSNSSSSNNDTDSSAEPEEDFDGWASGGTSAMTSDFPDDSLFDTASVCSVALTGSQTEGPCYFQSDYLDDISY
ncbi:MAG: intradiol ring-cleavage dioxygenase, partial [Alteromonas sp.]|nr:intradiol ring-cleavage dioxygenase [Alteromonas sp.]